MCAYIRLDTRYLAGYSARYPLFGQISFIRSYILYSVKSFIRSDIMQDIRYPAYTGYSLVGYPTNRKSYESLVDIHARLRSSYSIRQAQIVCFQLTGKTEG